MAVIESPTKSAVQMEVDPLWFAGRQSIRPLDYTNAQGRILGHYSAVGTTSALAFAASANLAAFRFADTASLAVILRIWASVQVVTAVTAQRVDALLAFVARGYTARDGTNATAIAFTATSTNKLRSSMGATALSVAAGGNLDVASAAAGVSGGTKTVDTNPFSFLGLSGSAAIAGLGTGAAGDLYNWTRLGGHPIVLSAQEGILVQWGATALATGTATLTVGIEWAEVPAF